MITQVPQMLQQTIGFNQVMNHSGLQEKQPADVELINLYCCVTLTIGLVDTQLTQAIHEDEHNQYC
jgi:hypothetical protein